MRLKYFLLGILLILIFGGSFLYFAYLRPIPKFQPTGEYSVGATNFDFEFTSEITGNTRKINVRTWYPSNATSGDINPVSSSPMNIAVVKAYGMPEFLAEIEPSLSYKDAPIASGAEVFPAIIFNHGHGAFAEQNTVNMQELASHGYIIFSISHPETSLLTEYTDGTNLKYDPSQPAFADVENTDFEVQFTSDIIEAVAAVNTVENLDEYWQTMQNLAQNQLYSNLQPIIHQWAEDSNALIDAMVGRDFAMFPDMLVDRIDAQNIGIFGHSLGGMTAIYTAILNDNIKAVINLDGIFALDIPIENIKNLPPICAAMAQSIILGNDLIIHSDLNTSLIEQSDQGGCVAVFRDALHMNFTDLNYQRFLRLLSVVGTVNQEKFGIELNGLLVHFFDRHLKGDNAAYQPVFDGMVDYREY